MRQSQQQEDVGDAGTKGGYLENEVELWPKHPAIFYRFFSGLGAEGFWRNPLFSW
jgi:hypothetical protein